MRILQVSSAEFLGGGERYLADLTNALVARGHEVFAALRPNSPLVAQLSIPVENILTLALRNSLDAPTARSLANFSRQNKIEIVHAHMARDYPLAAYASIRNKESSLIVTRHVLFPMNRLHKLTLSRVAKVIAVSEAVAVQLRAERIIPDEKIAVILNGVDTSRFDKALLEFDRDAFLRKWKLPADARLIGTVGELKALKGQEEFLQAAAEIAREISNAYFIVAGVDSSRDQRQRKLLEQLTNTLGLQNRVRFSNWLDDIAELYCALDIFVSASRAESFGLALAEAMATGTAVIATMTEGAKQLIATGETGVLVQVEDAAAIARAALVLLKDETQREQLAVKARAVVHERFSLARMVDATEKLYSEAVQRR